jgi:hypothetical protein
VTARGGGADPFAGLLPESRRLSGLRGAVKTSAEGDLTLLRAVGLDRSATTRGVPADCTRARRSPSSRWTRRSRR